MAIRNINPAYGDPIMMESVEEFESLIGNMGYDMPADGLIEGRDYDEIMEINFVERGNGFPPGNAILVNHEDQTAYRVMTYAETGDPGSIRTYGPGQGNEVTLYVEEQDYEDHHDDEDAWEV